MHILQMSRLRLAVALICPRSVITQQHCCHQIPGFPGSRVLTLSFTSAVMGFPQRSLLLQPLARKLPCFLNSSGNNGTKGLKPPPLFTFQREQRHPDCWVTWLLLSCLGWGSTLAAVAWAALRNGRRHLLLSPLQL